MALKPGGFWRLRRSMTVRRAPRRAKIGGVGLQIIRDWVLRFNARGPNALVNGKSPGPSSMTSSVRPSPR